MAGKPNGSDRLAHAREFPWLHGFMPLMRHIAAVNSDRPRVGLSPRPQDEMFRLGQQASLTFAPREIAEVAWRDGRPLIRLLGLGMLGPNGPLPLHFTEMVRDRRESRRDGTLGNFLDVFHHRYLAHLYRAWAQSQAAAGLDRADAETFTPYVARLAGDDPAELDHSPLPAHARWASAAHRVREARNPDGLVATLSRYFGVEVKMQEYVLHWIGVEAEDTCRLGKPRMSSMLGQGALAGEVAPDRQQKFKLIIGPLSLDRYLRFTPQGGADGEDMRALVEWVRAFVGYEYVWEAQLVVQRDAAAPTRLGGDERLGWSTWMGRAITYEDVTGMIFEPENYVKNAAWNREK